MCSINPNKLARIRLHYITRNLIWADVCAFSFQATSRVGFALVERRHLKREMRKLRILAWRHTVRSYFNWRMLTLRQTVSATSSFAPWELSARRWRSPYVWPVCPLCLSWCSFLVSKRELNIDDFDYNLDSKNIWPIIGYA